MLTFSEGGETEEELGRSGVIAEPVEEGVIGPRAQDRDAYLGEQHIGVIVAGQLAVGHFTASSEIEHGIKRRVLDRDDQLSGHADPYREGLIG